MSEPLREEDPLRLIRERLNQIRPDADCCDCTAMNRCPIWLTARGLQCTRAELQAALGDQAAQPGLSGSGTIPDGADQSKPEPAAPELLPCPFCGDEAIYGYNCASRIAHVFCQKCGGRSRDCDSREEARRVWNLPRRHPANKDQTLSELLKLVFKEYWEGVILHQVENPVSFGTYCERFAPPEVRNYLTKKPLEIVKRWNSQQHVPPEANWLCIVEEGDNFWHARIGSIFKEGIVVTGRQNSIAYTWEDIAKYAFRWSTDRKNWKPCELP